MKTSVLSLLFVCCSLFSQGQSTLLKDICPGGCDSDPTNLTTIGTTMYFSATDSIHGEELWKTNGTAAGTVMVKELFPGPGVTYLSNFTPCYSRLFFTNGDVYGDKLFVSDGTSKGTYMVKDINPGTGSSSISDMVAINGVLYFVADDGVHGKELWRSDGTSVGTKLLRDFKVGAANGGIESMVNFQNKLVFARSFYSPDSGYPTGSQLWQYDPITKAYSILYGMKGKFMDDLTVHLGNLFYGVGESWEYTDVYRMNKDRKGGTLLTIRNSFRLGWLKSSGGKLLVGEIDEYYSWRITAIKPLNGNTITNLGQAIYDVASVNGTAYMTAWNYNEFDMNGTFVHSIYKDSASTAPLVTMEGVMQEIEALNGRAVFVVQDSAYGDELYVLTPNAAREGLLSDRGTAEEGDNIRVYPNPASSQVTVEGKTMADGLIRLHDVQGREYVREPVYRGEVINKRLDVSALSNGVYLLKVNGQTHKLLIAK